MAEYNLLFNVGARHVWKRKEYPFGRKAKLNKGGIAVIPRKLLMDVLAILDFIGNVIWRQNISIDQHWRTLERCIVYQYGAEGDSKN